MTFQRIYEAVRMIPEGKVARYADIAHIVGISDCRLVGYALHANSSPSLVPCHRVVRKDGSLANGYAFGGYTAQRSRLEREGIAFNRFGQIDLKKFLWTTYEVSEGEFPHVSSSVS